MKFKITQENYKITVVIFFIICGIIIGYPFFAFKFFETHNALVTTTKYFLLPILLLTIIGVPYLYSKYLLKYDKLLYESNLKKSGKKEMSNTKKTIGTIMMYFFLILMFSGILFGIFYSTIITSNAYLGTSESIYINESVQAYETHTDKYGKLRRYIKFYSPVDKRIIEMQVYRQYNIGEKFEKEMKIGRWNILYSKD